MVDRNINVLGFHTVPVPRMYSKHNPDESNMKDNKVHILSFQ